MKIKVIGGDGAFSYDNSSFLIEIPIVNDKIVKILFDCGVNTFNYIKDNNIDIDYVFISHTHFDHISGLEQLIYYRYFVQNKITRIICGPEIQNELSLIFKDMRYYYENGELIPTTMFEFVLIDNLRATLNQGKYFYKIDLIKGNHIIKVNYGLMILENKEKKGFLITGDTKACRNIKNIIKKEAIINGYNLIVFHDFSFWNDPYKNIHCCKSDFEYYYNEFDNYNNIKWYLYHNEEFNENYKNEEILII